MCDPSDNECRPVVLCMMSPAGAIEESCKQVATFIAKRVRSIPYERFVLVASVDKDEIAAVSRPMTDQLHGRLSGRSRDRLWLAAEVKEVALLAFALEKSGIATCASNVQEAGVKVTGKRHNNAIISIDPTFVQGALTEYFAVVIPGSFGTTLDGTIVSVGNGAGVRVAIAVAQSIRAFRCEMLEDTSTLDCSSGILGRMNEGPRARCLDESVVDAAKSAKIPVLVRSLRNHNALRWVVSRPVH